MYFTLEAMLYKAYTLRHKHITIEFNNCINKLNCIIVPILPSFYIQLCRIQHYIWLILELITYLQFICVAVIATIQNSGKELNNFNLF